MKIRRRKKKETWIEFPSMKSSKIEKNFQETFNLRTLVLTFVDILIGTFISVIIEEPLIAIAHFLRTFEWIYGLNLLGILVFLGMIVGFLIFFYVALKPLRKDIYEEFKRERVNFNQKIISIVFALLFIDIFVSIATYVSDIVSMGEITFDLGSLIDNIIASMILLVFMVASYYALKKYYN